jgi:glycosyltransferase involved in cell wall biosynthesis
MRIALVVPGGVDRSGEYRVIPALLALIERLSHHHDVHVIALSQESQAAAWHLAGAHIHNIGVQHTGLRALLTIYKIHRRSPFDVVQAIWCGPCGLIAAIMGKVLRIPSVIHVAGGELVSMREIGYGGAQTRAGALRETLVLRQVSAVTAASTPIIDALAKLRIAAHRIPLGVDLLAWPPRPPVRRDPNKPARLIHIASLNRVKDQSTLLQALAALMNSGTRFEMNIVGEDTLHGEIQSLCEELRLSSVVRFHGFLTQRQLRPLVEAADVLVLSSRHETGPVVALEAAVVGVPTAGTRVGHVKEWAPLAAESAAVGDWAGLSMAIRRLLEDEDLRMCVAREAFRRATREDADYTAGRFRCLYAQLI